ncbi:hypothetical protein, partial [Flavobacterium sp. ALJ2]|uniref:hypothetical protein n=1 Tax=Flavobacterium sp. ALJ2 TaxID=2786960 RepID=UPI001E537022
EDKKEYLIIEFNRWSSEDQPRGTGEDQLGEDISYIFGIWENPLLTDAIIAKIKNNEKQDKIIFNFMDYIVCIFKCKCTM